DEVAALEHLARDFGVAALVRFEQVERQARIEQQCREYQQQEQRQRSRSCGRRGRSAGEEARPEERRPGGQGGGHRLRRGAVHRKRPPPRTQKSEVSIRKSLPGTRYGVWT